jgi:hypothetical protein
MHKSIVAALAAGLLVSAMPASAELEPYKDYVPSTEVWNVTFVRVNPNRLGDYLEGLKQTWLAACDAQKKAGVILDCSIFVSDTMANRDFNVLLVLKAPNAAVGDPNEKIYKQIDADIRAKLAQDKEKKLVAGYEDMRSFYGEQNFRKLAFK